jgi:hypothetical protein
MGELYHPASLAMREICEISSFLSILAAPLLPVFTSCKFSNYRSRLELRWFHCLKVRLDLLDLFFNPLLADLILFLECDTFDFGTARSIGGNSSASVSSIGASDRLQGVVGRSSDRVVEED